MTFARETLPQIVRSEGPANFRGVARWKGLLHSKLVNQYHVLHDRKSGNVTSPEEFIVMAAIALCQSANFAKVKKTKAYPYISRMGSTH
ncbi:hypothetical protein V1477_001492 [Vespula maculifrons]|uniref:Uncharacterized protein n=1 Tax=Vespula maculifrons TaxID=7453 RepID=A0ABD2D1M9_VESMC